jgi:hypothetical protein
MTSHKPKKIVREGFAQAMDGESLLVNTTTDEMVQITIKDKDLRWALYCKHVRITIEEIDELTVNQSQISKPTLKRQTRLFCCQAVNDPEYEERNITEIPECIFLVSGYSVGGRLLEDVEFEVRFSPDGDVLKIDVTEGISYFNSLNQQHWLEKVKKRVQKILANGDEVNIPERLQKKYYKNGINCSYITSVEQEE